jgi:DHA1 family multidrug resistance protein-like MFS transporter
LSRLQSGIGSPWVQTVGVLLAAQVVSELAFGFALPFTPLYLQQLGVDGTVEVGLWAGLIAGIYAIAMGGMAPVWGLASDRFGYKRMIQRALLGSGLLIVLMMFVQTPVQLLVLRVLQGTLTGVVSAIVTLVSLTAPHKYMATLFGMLQAAMYLGAALGPILGGAFADRFGLRAGFGMTGVLLFIIGALVTVVVREPTREPRRSEGSETAGPPERLVTRDLLIVITLMGVARFVNWAPQPILPLYVQQLVGDSDTLGTTVGLVLGATGIAATVSALLVGRLGDRVGLRLALFGSIGLGILVSPLHLLVTSVWQLVLVRSLFGLAIGGMSPAIQALLIRVSPARKRGAAFGLLTAANAAGNGGGPVVGSLVAAVFGVQAVFLSSVPVLAGATWLLARLQVTGNRGQGKTSL